MGLSYTGVRTRDPMTKSALDMMADLPQEADEEPEPPGAPADDFTRSLVGLSSDDAFWKCIRADVDIRVGVEDGQEMYYSPTYFPFPWRGGVYIDVTQNVVVASRYVGPDPNVEPPKKKSRR